MQSEYIGNGNLGNDAVVQKQGMVRLKLMRHKMRQLGLGRQLALEKQWPTVGSYKDSHGAAPQGKQEKCW